MSTSRELNEFEQKIIQNVHQFGCHVNYVFDPDGEQPSFSYSIGFPVSVNQPEIIVFGLDSKLMHFMINETLRLCRSGLTLCDWTRVEGLLENYQCIARVVAPENIVPDYFGSALWHYRYRTGSPLDRAVQIVWPGAASGLFPWEEGSDQTVRDLQPALYHGKSN